MADSEPTIVEYVWGNSKRMIHIADPTDKAWTLCRVANHSPVENVDDDLVCPDCHWWTVVLGYKTKE